MTKQPTVAVIGTGTMGAMTLWQLARLGVRATGYDRFAPGHGFGSAGGDTRMFRSAYQEGAAYGPLLKAAQVEWRELEAEIGVDLLTMTGGLMVGPANGAFIRNVENSIVENDLPFEMYTAQELRAKYPQNVVFDDEIGIFDFGSGVLRSEYSVAAAADAATRRGARLRTHTAVTAIDPVDAGVCVRTSNGDSVIYDRVVVAAGAWTNQLLAGSMPRLDVQSIAVHWYPVRNPKAFGYGHYPILCRDAEYNFCVWPSTDGATVKVGLNAGLEHLTSADDLKQTMPLGLVPIVDDYVRRFLPDAIPNASRHAVQMDAWTADHDFIIGTLPSDDRITVLAGFSGHGFKMAPIIGKVAASLAVTGESPVPIDRFAVGRFAANPTLR